MAALALCGALLCLLSPPRPALAQAGAQTGAFGYRVAAPFMMESPNGDLSGLEFDLAQAIMAEAGIALKPRVQPYSRNIENFRRGLIAGIAPFPQSGSQPGCVSDNFITYRNIAMTRGDMPHRIETVRDLYGLRVIAFQNARNALAGLREAEAGLASYDEVAEQRLQIRALLANRVDVVLGEERILRHYIARARGEGMAVPEIVEHRTLFQPNPYGAAFQKAEHCAAFNAALARMRNDGRYDAIMRRYSDPS